MSAARGAVLTPSAPIPVNEAVLPPTIVEFTVRVVVWAPVAVGAKTMLKTHEAPTPSEDGQLFICVKTVLAWPPEVVTVAPKKVRLDVPVFVNVMDLVELEPVVTWP